MTPNLRDQLAAVYAERRRSAETARDRRVRAYHEMHPELVALNHRITQTGARLLELSLADPDPEDTDARSDRDRVAAELADLQAARRAWLEAEDLDPDYTEPAYRCGTCKDRGEISGAPCPDCHLATWVPLLFAWDESHAPEGSFDTFDPELFRDTVEPADRGRSPRTRMRDIRDFATRWADTFPDTKKDLTFVGRTGTGKSFTAAAILRAVQAKGIPAIYQTAAGFFERIRDYRVKQQSFRPDPADYAAAKDRFDAITTVPLLIIDDLGREPHPAQSTAELLELLDRRHQANLRTIIVSNLDLRRLAQTYDERLTSRLGGHSYIIDFPGTLAGDDVRIRPPRP